MTILGAVSTAKVPLLNRPLPNLIAGARRVSLSLHLNTDPTREPYCGVKLEVITDNSSIKSVTTAER